MTPLSILAIASNEVPFVGEPLSLECFAGPPTIVVPPDAPARAVAAIVDHCKISAVFVVTHDLVLRGIVVPSSLVADFNREAGTSFFRLEDVINELEEMANSGTESQRGWLSSLGRPTVFRCRIDRKIYFTPKCPVHQLSCDPI